MKGEIKEVWLIVECPKCHRPQVKNKFVHDNVVRFMKLKWDMTCDICDESFYVEPELIESDDWIE